MRRLLKYSLASLVVCLCLSVLAPPNGQTKKFTIRGHVEGYVTEVFPDGSFTTYEEDIGESTFFGRHVNTFTSTYTPVLDNGVPVIIDGLPLYSIIMAGTSSPANRKASIDWVGVNLPVPTVTFTGGPDKIQGGFTSTLSNFQMDMDDGTLSYDYVGKGEVTFPPK